MAKTLAVITARGGSKRIPKKNIREFCGQPIIAYSIQAALASGLFDAVMVSTDDREIAEISAKYGAEIPFMRSAETADDYATTEDALMEVLERYRDLGRSFDLVCNLYPTAPFITAERLKEAYDLISAGDCNVVFPVVPFAFPPQRGLYDENGFITPASPADYMKRSQDFRPVYHDCGQFYFYRVDSFLGSGSTVDHARPLIISEMEVQDIDTLTDWELAEMKYRLRKSSEGKEDRDGSIR
ncbi:MAG: pseudaminic acid cytidylyltransferase [Lachnospiraceae bacterium]|nr:pseudaminic acid cytidylyltransferase [Lachnospiraceae bacterium]